MLYVSGGRGLVIPRRQEVASPSALSTLAKNHRVTRRSQTSSNSQSELLSGSLTCRVCWLFTYCSVITSCAHVAQKLAIQNLVFKKSISIIIDGCPFLELILSNKISLLYYYSQHFPSKVQSKISN